MKHPQWPLGFFSLFALSAVPGLLEGEWGQAVWLVWIVWAIFFFIEPEKGDDTPSGETSSRTQADDRVD